MHVNVFVQRDYVYGELALCNIWSERNQWLNTRYAPSNTVNLSFRKKPQASWKLLSLLTINFIKTSSNLSKLEKFIYSVCLHSLHSDTKVHVSDLFCISFRFGLRPNSVFIYLFLINKMWKWKTMLVHNSMQSRYGVVSRTCSGWCDLQSFLKSKTSLTDCSKQEITALYRNGFVSVFKSESPDFFFYEKTM